MNQNTIFITQVLWTSNFQKSGKSHFPEFNLKNSMEKRGVWSLALKSAFFGTTMSLQLTTIKKTERRHDSKIIWLKVRH